MHETVISCSWESLVKTAITRGSIRPALRSATPTSSSTTFSFLSNASPSGGGGRRLGHRLAAGADLLDLLRLDEPLRHVVGVGEVLGLLGDLRHRLLGG